MASAEFYREQTAQLSLSDVPAYLKPAGFSFNSNMASTEEKQENNACFDFLYNNAPDGKPAKVLGRTAFEWGKYMHGILPCNVRQYLIYGFAA